MLLLLNGVDGFLSFYCLEGEPDRGEDSIPITALAEYLWSGTKRARPHHLQSLIRLKSTNTFREQILNFLDMYTRLFE
jgi:hypothetical protein